MKKIFVILLVVFAFSSCKKHCYTCTNFAGQEVGKKCFKSNDDMLAYNAAQASLPVEDQCR